MPKMKTETVDAFGKKFKVKEGALRKQLKMKKDEKFTRAELNKLSKVEDGKKFKFHDREFKMTKLMKQRIGLAKGFATARRNKKKK
jgi:hypothetical protein